MAWMQVRAPSATGYNGFGLSAALLAIQEAASHAAEEEARPRPVLQILRVFVVVVCFVSSCELFAIANVVAWGK